MKLLATSLLIWLAISTIAVVSTSTSAQEGGRVFQPDGTPAADVWFGFCVVSDICFGSFYTDQEGDMTHALEDAVPQLSGDYYIWLWPRETDSYHVRDSFRGYYHEDSPGNFSTTRGRRTIFSPIDGIPSLLSVTLRQPDTIDVVIPATDNRILNIAACPNDTIVWACNYTRDSGHLNSVSSPSSPTTYALATPHEDFFVAVQRDFGRFYYYQHDAPGHLTTDPLNRTRFARGGRSDLPLEFDFTHIDTMQITIELKPGANLVGWRGGAISLSQSCSASTELLAVLVVQNESAFGPAAVCQILGQARARETEDARSTDSAVLKPGTVAWFYWGGNDAQTVTFVTPKPELPIALEPGRQYLAWLGPNGLSLDLVALTLGVNADAIRLLRTRQTEFGAGQASIVNPGDVMLVELPDPTRWMPPIQLRPDLVSIDARARQDRQALVDAVALAQEIFLRTFGATVSDLTVLHSTDFMEHAGFELWPRARAGRSTIWTMTLDPITIAHEYFHVIQFEGGHHPLIPIWLVEGSAQYAERLFAMLAGVVTEREQVEWRDQVVSYAVKWDTPLSELERSSWGPDSDFEQAVIVYWLGALAVEYLVQRHGGNRAVMNLFMLDDILETVFDPSHLPPFHAQFERAFGLTLEEFYAAFSNYRANGFQLDDK